MKEQKISHKNYRMKKINPSFPSCLQKDELKYLLKYRRVQEKVKVRQCKINGSSSQVLLEISYSKGKKKKFHNEKKVQSVFRECHFLVVTLH